MTTSTRRYRPRLFVALFPAPLPPDIRARLAHLADDCEADMLASGELVRVEVGGDYRICTPEEAAALTGTIRQSPV